MRRLVCSSVFVSTPCFGTLFWLTFSRFMYSDKAVPEHRHLLSFVRRFENSRPARAIRIASTCHTFELTWSTNIARGELTYRLSAVVADSLVDENKLLDVDVRLPWDPSPCQLRGPEGTTEDHGQRTSSARKVYPSWPAQTRVCRAFRSFG